MASINALNTASPIEVGLGGTGVATLTAYAVICGGTTTTNPVQSIASVGTAAQVLTSNGAAALPTFQAVATTNMSFQVLGSDPGSPTDGQVWYRSDTDVFRGRANGATVTFTVS